MAGIPCPAQIFSLTLPQNTTITEINILPMDVNRIDQFILMHGNKFPTESVPMIREQLGLLDDSQFTRIAAYPYKSPTVALIISLLIGSLGIDRFYLGQVGLGIAKLLTGGGCGVWTIVDWFLIMGATRRKNYEVLVTYF